MLKDIEEKLAAAKFVPDLKKVVADFFTAFMEYSATVDERLTRLEVVALEHAKLLDPAAFNEEADAPPTPADAATDAPMEETEEKSEV